MAATTGMSSSCMGRISTAANSCSRLTLDIRAHGAREFQIFPTLALVGRRAQQVGGMVGDDQGHLGNSESVYLLAQTAQCLVRPQQVLCGDTSHGQHYLR